MNLSYDASIKVKLILLLTNHSFFIKGIDKFIELVRNDQIPFPLVVYLYNYLYKYGYNEILEISYEDGTIALKEKSVNDELDSYKYSFIKQENKLSDIKRTTLDVIGDKAQKQTRIKKHVHYSLSTNIDLIVLETEECTINEEVEDAIIGSFLRIKYKGFYYLHLGNPTLQVYDAIEQTEEGPKKSFAYLYKDSMHRYLNDESLPRENITSSAEQAKKRLRELYNSDNNVQLYDEIISPGNVNLTDEDIRDFSEDFAKQ